MRTYNQQTHRAEPLSRIEDWITHVPTEGIREMCSWDQFCRFAREPERRKVGPDARITTDGTAYELEPEMAGDYVVLLWGLFDDELHAEFDGERFGPHYPVSGPIPQHRYRAFKRSKADERSARIRSLADQLGLPIAALSGEDVRLEPGSTDSTLPIQPFVFEPQESRIAAKPAIAEELAMPLAKLSMDDRAFIDQVLSETLATD